LFVQTSFTEATKRLWCVIFPCTKLGLTPSNILRMLPQKSTPWNRFSDAGFLKMNILSACNYFSVPKAAFVPLQVCGLMTCCAYPSLCAYDCPKITTWFECVRIARYIRISAEKVYKRIKRKKTTNRKIIPD